MGFLGTIKVFTDVGYVLDASSSLDFLDGDVWAWTAPIPTPVIPQMGFLGTIKVFSDVGYVNVLDVFSSPNFLDGDVWAWTAPIPTPVVSPSVVPQRFLLWPRG